MKGILLLRNCFQFPLVNVIVNKIAFTSLENIKNEHFFATSHRKVIWENVSGTPDVSYWSKVWKGWSGLSIAQARGRIRRVEATNNANEERMNSMLRSVPRKKHAQLFNVRSSLTQHVWFGITHERLIDAWLSRLSVSSKFEFKHFQFF